MGNNHDDVIGSFMHNLSCIYLSGDKVVVRDMETRELQSVSISIYNPERRCYFVKHRLDNIFAKVAETLWMLRGRNDVEWLSFYLPRALDYSDDGRTWRGAYGPRLRNWNGSDKKADQLINVVTKLNLDPLTRQAVISLWDPSEDFLPTKDVPCNNWLHFFIRNGYLNMNVAQRSSDILWGYSGIDTFSWSVLMQMMAYWSSTKVGTFTHFISSLHLYEKHYETAKKIIERKVLTGEFFSAYNYDLKVPDFHTEIYDFDNKLDWIFDLEHSAREEVDGTLFEWVDSTLMDPLLSTFAKMLLIYIYIKNNVPLYDNLAAMISTLPESDLRVAVVEYLTRNSMDLFGYYTPTDTERKVLAMVYDRDRI